MGRSKWKGNILNNNQNLDKKNKSQIINKNVTIVPKLLNQIFKVYTGKTFSKVTTTKDMLGHKIGEFILTRAKYIFKQKKNKKKLTKK